MTKERNSATEHNEYLMKLHRKTNAPVVEKDPKQELTERFTKQANKLGIKAFGITK